MKFYIGFAAVAAVVLVILHFLGIINWAGLYPMYGAITGLSLFGALAFWHSTRVHKE